MGHFLLDSCTRANNFYVDVAMGTREGQCNVQIIYSSLKLAIQMILIIFSTLRGEETRGKAVDDEGDLKYDKVQT